IIPMRRLLLTSIALALTIGLTAQEEPLGFVERFALAEDRGATLGELIPGTEDWYYWHCIHAQHEERFADVPPLLAAWIERHGRTARVQQIENRQALLTFTRDPAGDRSLSRFGRDQVGWEELRSGRRSASRR